MGPDQQVRRRIQPTVQREIEIQNRENNNYRASGNTGKWTQKKTINSNTERRKEIRQENKDKEGTPEIRRSEDLPRAGNNITIQAEIHNPSGEEFFFREEHKRNHIMVSPDDTKKNKKERTSPGGIEEAEEPETNRKRNKRNH
ncbi:Hypothetical predicted protein [Pelobates cultripes]|uniref:Uncharacterized protein n=1 Tax=Pelobates cultripes TaxID=61616 RepID=A0AAD1R0F5_PELCU|nr:Hypothetical predicted protein [Pelobates cultripes]